MDEQAMQDALARDKSIVELRALLASYEERLARGIAAGPEPHAARAHVPEPLFLLNDVAVDLRSPAGDTGAVMEAPTIVDCFQPAEPESFSFVFKVSAGVFRVHPRPGRITAAIVGPFSGPAPTGLIAIAQTTHGAAPAVRFHIGIWRGEIDTAAVTANLNKAGRQSRFLTLPPRRQGYLVATPGAKSRPVGAPADTSWGLLLATIADPPGEISNAWAEFSGIALIFSTDSGSEVRLLS